MITGKFRNNIRFRFIGIICLVLLIGTLLLSTFIGINKRNLLRSNLLANGETLASFIALQSVDRLVMKDYTELDSLVNDSHKEDIVYAVISDENGTLLTSQFASINYQSPRFKAIVSRLSRESELQDIIEAVKRQEPITEISVPVMMDVKRVGTVTIGISDYRVRGQILKTISSIVALNIGVACVLGFVLFAASRKMILDPIAELTRATSALSGGDLSARVKVETTGEVKVLADRFNQMLDNLEKVIVSRDYVDTILKSMIDTLIILSPANTIVMANAAALALLCYDEKELVGMPMETIFDLNPAGRDAIIGEIRLKGHIRNIETVYRTKEGVKVSMLFSASTMSLPNRTRGILCVAKDITDRERSEEERRKLVSQLIQAQKMESIGQLAGGIAHDFNNILTTIIGYCHLIHMKMAGDDPARKDVDQILAASERAASLTHGLLAFSRKQVISPKDLDLNEVVRGLNKFLARIIGEKIELSVSSAKFPLIVFADSTQLDQIMMNLAGNARDAMPNGGELRLETGKIELNEDFARKHGFGTPGVYAFLIVTDTGAGMDARTKEKIFDPFFTTKEQGKGTGLGLSIVYGIVKQNKGYITVDSGVGRGTTFKIYLPLVNRSASENGSDHAVLPIRGGKETILVAEDNEGVRNLTHEVLSGYGYTVIQATDGEEALQKFERNKEKIDLLIVDVVMPRKNGKEVFEAARRFKPDIKAIFTSGYPADLIQKEGILESGLNFLSKPSSTFDFLRKVREVLDA